MRKTRLLILLFGVVVLVGVDLTIILKLFNSPKSSNFYISLIFVNIGLIFETIFLLLTTAKDKDAVIHGLALYLISYGYVLAEVELAIMFSFKFEWNSKVALLSQLILLLTYSAYAILTMIGIVNQKADRKQYEVKVAYITSAKNDVLDIMGMLEKDSECYKLLDKLQESIYYSDPMSNDDLYAIEAELKEKIEFIKNKVANGELDGLEKDIKEASIILEKRNRKCQEMKMQG